MTFSVVIPANPSNPALLQPSPLTLQLRSERKGGWLASSSWQAEGKVTVDLSDIAVQGFVSRNYLVRDSLLNATLNLAIRVTHTGGDRIFTVRNAEDVRDDQSVESAGPSRAATAAASGSVGVSMGDFVDGAQLGGAAMEASPSVILDASIPKPEVVQRKVYEKMFQMSVRDAWQNWIVESRVGAVEEVERVYSNVCAQDGIGAVEKKGGAVENLLESGINESGGSRRLSVRSSSMGELKGLV